MAHILRGSSLGEHVHPISVEFYHSAGELGLINEQVELLQGVIFNKMSKSPLHSAVVLRLLALLNTLNLDGFCVRKEEPLTTSDSEPEPDLAVCAGSEDNYFNSHPKTAELVIEVAISSLEIDRQKAEIYAEAGVKEYWIVMPKSREIEIYTQPNSGIYAQRQALEGSSEVSSQVFPQFSVRIPDLFLPPSS